MRIAPRIDQLSVHPHPIAGATHRAFQDMGNAKRLTDLAQVAVPVRYCCTEVRLMTFRSAIRARLERISSCTPSAKKVFSRSSLRFSKGSTAMLFSGDGTRGRRSRILGPLDPGGSDIVGPGQDDRDRKPKDEGSDDEPHGPGRDFVKWKNLGVDLNQDPGDHDIGDRDAIDFAPFQFGEKLLQRRAPGRRARMEKGHRMVMPRLRGSGKCCLCSARKCSNIVSCESSLVLVPRKQRKIEDDDENERGRQN